MIPSRISSIGGSALGEGSSLRSVYTLSCNSSELWRECRVKPREELGNENSAAHSRKRRNPSANTRESEILHSQIVKTCQPSARSSPRLAASRCRLRSILDFQYSQFVLGMRQPRAQSCPCQKHPCTKIAFRRAGNTRSGVPGSSLRCNRNLNPRR